MTKRILAVDDHELNLEIVKAYLKDDYELLTAKSGEEALEVIKDFKPDAVLLDIMMPGLDGYEVCRLLKADEDLCSSVVIILTAKAMPDERQKGIDAGADAYLTKPFRKDELRDSISALI
ncbi:MAG: response regulator [Pseudomonadota bacterium]